MIIIDSTPFAHICKGWENMINRHIDLELVKRAKAGDKRAFNLLVFKYQYKIGHIIAHYVKNHAETLDLVQETFIKAYKALPAFRGESAFYTWLYRIAVNTAKNYLISQERRVPDVDVDLVDAEQFDTTALNDDASPEHIVISEEVEKVVVGKIESLPEELREAIILCEFEGESYQAIADKMHCPVGTVRSRIFRAREAIHHSLRDYI